MTVYVDDYRQPARVGRLHSKWSHLTADTKEELHAFAENKLRLKREWFQHGNDHLWHYDVTDGKRDHAIKCGAVPITTREMVELMVARKEAKTGGIACNECAADGVCERGCITDDTGSNAARPTGVVGK